MWVFLRTRHLFTQAPIDHRWVGRGLVSFYQRVEMGGAHVLEPEIWDPSYLHLNSPFPRTAHRAFTFPSL